MNGTQFIYIVSTFCVILSPTYADCVSLLDLANRPSVLDSACSTPYQKVIIEANYVTQQLNGHGGTQQNFPNTDVRIGLPANTEWLVSLPNYIRQRSAPGSGSTGVSSGIKHSFYYNDKWQFAIDGIIYIPSGSYKYGNGGWGGTLNGIVSYTITPKWNISGMIGVSEISEPRSFKKGRNYDSINPDITLGYAPYERLSVYGEIYGQSRIDIGQGAGFNFDAGVLFLATPFLVLNFSVGQQLYGYLDGFTHYVNIGASILL